MTDISDARFYVIDGDRDAACATAQPLKFPAAFDKACDLTDNGQQIKVLYTGDATKTEITRFVHEGIPIQLISGV